MAAITNLDRVKAIAAADTFIQGLAPTDPIVVQALAYADNQVKSSHYGIHTLEAQDFLVAHMLSMAGQPNGGRGPLSSRTVGRINTSFTLPYLNRTTVLGATQYGNRFIDIRNMVTVAFRVIVSA